MTTLSVLDSPTQVALIGVASLVVSSLTAIILAWIGLKQNLLSKKQDDLAGAVAEVKKQTDGITSKLVDATGRAHQAEGELKGRADSQVRQDGIDESNSVRALKAEPAVETLKEIEKHTADTAANTAKTDATVQDLKDKV